MAVILIVEDDPTTRKLLKDLLVKVMRHEVHETSSLQEGVGTAGRIRPDLILLDHSLPDGNALEFCRSLSRKRGLGAIPKWIITGQKLLDWDERLWGPLGVRGCLIKPFELKEIQFILDQCLKPSLP